VPQQQQPARLSLARRAAASAALRRFTDKLAGLDTDLLPRRGRPAAPQAPPHDQLRAAAPPSSGCAAEVVGGGGTGVSGTAAGKQEAAEGAQRRGLTVEQQVGALLRAATAGDNLARMYEGWTPWL